MYYLVDISYLNEETEKKTKEKVLVKPATNSYTEVESIIINEYSKKDLFSLDNIAKKKDIGSAIQKDDNEFPFHEVTVSMAYDEETVKEVVVIPAPDTESAIKHITDSYTQNYPEASIKVVKYVESKINTLIEVV